MKKSLVWHMNYEMIKPVGRFGPPDAEWMYFEDLSPFPVNAIQLIYWKFPVEYLSALDVVVRENSSSIYGVENTSGVEFLDFCREVMQGGQNSFFLMFLSGMVAGGI